MKYAKLNKQFVNLRVILEHISESNELEVGAKNAQLTMRLKTLFTISGNKNCTPSLLIEKLSIAKSNLAIICKGLIDEELIVSEKNENDKRNIYYNITPKGEKELNDYYEMLENKITQNVNAKEIKILEKKIDDITIFLNKIFAKKKV